MIPAADSVVGVSGGVLGLGGSPDPTNSGITSVLWLAQYVFCTSTTANLHRNTYVQHSRQCKIGVWFYIMLYYLEACFSVCYKQHAFL